MFLLTSNARVINQRVNTPKRFPSPPYGRLDGVSVARDVEFDGNSSRGPRLIRRAGGKVKAVDFVAEGLEAIDSACRGDNPAAGPGQVEAELAAQAGGSTGDHHDLVVEFAPWLETVCLRRRSFHFSFVFSLRRTEQTSNQ